MKGARQSARRFLATPATPRVLARSLSRMYVVADYPEELAVWSGLDDWYDMVEQGVLSGELKEGDAATVDAARLLVEHRAVPPEPVSRLVVERPPLLSRIARGLWQRKRAP
jgi:hypothetical protein